MKKILTSRISGYVELFIGTCNFGPANVSMKNLHLPDVHGFVLFHHIHGTLLCFESSVTEVLY
jgi:hypothetical protein